jgi:hypothetical protein
VTTATEHQAAANLKPPPRYPTPRSRSERSWPPGCRHLITITGVPGLRPKPHRERRRLKLSDPLPPVGHAHTHTIPHSRQNFLHATHPNHPHHIPCNPCPMTTLVPYGSARTGPGPRPSFSAVDRKGGLLSGLSLALVLGGSLTPVASSPGHGPLTFALPVPCTVYKYFLGQGAGGKRSRPTEAFPSLPSDHRLHHHPRQAQWCVRWTAAGWIVCTECEGWSQG